MTILSCSNSKIEDWRHDYIIQEKNRTLTVTRQFDFSSGSFIQSYVDSTLTTFNDKGQKLGVNDKHFYKYDSKGNVILEEYCLRTCDNPGKKIHYYDSLNRLIKTIIKFPNDKEWVDAQYFYNDKNLLIRKVMGNDSTPTTISYTYDNLNRKYTKTRKEFNTNVNEWLTFVDSMFYDTNNNLSIKKRRQIGKDLLTISKYSYKDTLLITQIDTTITTIPGYLPTPNTVHHAYFFRTDYKYNSDNKLIEKTTTQPDYKTPSFKVTYEYR